jgi:hypothetical protein
MIGLKVTVSLRMDSELDIQQIKKNAELRFSTVNYLQTRSYKFYGSFIHTAYIATYLKKTLYEENSLTIFIDIFN